MKGKNFSCSNTGKHIESEHYQTPYEITNGLYEKIKMHIKGKIMFDPACGDGAIVTALRMKDETSIGSDIVGGYDFYEQEFRVGHVLITNPPYSGLNKEKFVQHAINLGYEDIFMLMPLGFLQGQGRYDSGIYKNLLRVFPLTRMPMLKSTVRQDGKFETGMQALAWYWFIQQTGNKTTIEHIDCTGMIVRRGERDEQ